MRDGPICMVTWTSFQMLKRTWWPEPTHDQSNEEIEMTMINELRFVMSKETLIDSVMMV